MAFFEFPHTRTYDSDLGWLIKKMKEIIENVASQDAKIAAVEELAAELKEFVNTYFDNLDVQQEINEKIDAMVRDGSLLAILEEPVEAVTVSTITEWLEENITPTSPAVDASLTIAGAAADAKATGDAIEEDRDLIATLYQAEEVNNISLTSGSVLRENGSLQSNAQWSYSNAIDVNGCDYIRVQGTFTGLAQGSGLAHLVFSYWTETVSGFAIEPWRLVNETAVVDRMIKVPNGASYVRFSDTTANASGVTITRYRRNLSTRDFTLWRRRPLLDPLFPLTRVWQGVRYYLSDDIAYFNGTTAANTQFFMYASSVQYILRNGHTYRAFFHKVSGEATAAAYLQIFANGTAVQLVNAQEVNGAEFTIPADAADVTIRVILFAGTFTNARYLLRLEDTAEASREYTERKISTAAELYAFLKAPEPFTRIILEPHIYDLYTGLAETDIANDVQVPNSTYLRDVEIIGNRARLKMHVPATVAMNKPTIVNTYSVLNVIGNFYMRDTILDAYSCRYALHSESLDDPSAYYSEQRFENCDFLYSKNGGVTEVNATAVGIGGSLGQRYIFKNCHFQDNYYFRTFYIHTRDYNIGELRLDECFFENQDTGLQLSQYTGNKEKIPVNISNSIVGKVVFITQDGGNAENQFGLESVNSYIPTVVAQDTTLLYAPRRINSIAGTIDTSLNS